MEKLTETVEDYIKTVWTLSEYGSKNDLIPLGDLARQLKLAPGTVTVMIKRFTQDGWFEYEARKGCRLTPQGVCKAISILRKHRLLEYFLVETLGMNWDEVHQEAENLEHSLSDKVVEKLDEFLEFPSHDPHGKRICRSEEELETS
ncbi:metal-dependent transcriptional regulator [Spirochaeta cellobiosiphila]|uniref:metal-dependent transcriptional regulator n=1 Tax=Spirochaeta cellobiosiphila TaxID=504483 RepID=UPI00040E0A99|nr:metal-dependent transcriptional regulator [Spirochaeta cellobiosiphila]